MKIQARDMIDVENLDDMVRSHGWSLYAARMMEAIESQAASLEGDLDERATWKTRGFVAGLRRALAVPEILRAEAIEKSKGARA